VGEYAKAEDFLTKSLVIEQEILKPNQSNTFDLAVALFRLGNMSNAEGNYGNAIVYFKQASPIFEDLNKEKNYALNLLEWGWSEYVLGNYERADSLYATVLLIYKNNAENNTLEMAKAKEHKGWLEFSLG